MKISVAEKLLNLAKKKVKQAEVVFSQGQSRVVSFEDSKLKNIEANFSSSIGLRVIHQGKIGVAATNKLEEADNLVNKALAVSKFGPEAFFEFPKHTVFKEPRIFDKEARKIKDEDFVRKGHKIIKEFKQFNPKILSNLDFGLGVGESVLLNTSGLKVLKRGSRVSFGAWWDLVREGDMLQVWESQSSRCDNIDFDFYVNRARDKFRKAYNIVQIKVGRYPVIFTPRSIRSILRYIFLALNGKTVVKKSSRLMDKLGKKVFDGRLMIVDDGSLDWKMGSSKCDSEGVAVRPLALIENGIVKNFYYDLQTAAQMKARSTGHGLRGKAAALATPSLHNVIIQEGTESYKSILKNIKVGILAEQFLGAGQDNPYNGDFSMNLNLGYKIEKGKVVGRLKNTMIAGNAFELLKSGIGEISREIEWVGNAFKSPYIMLEGVSVVSK